ncbi:MAG TPA: hypothetical protein EYP03_02895 [Aquificae bacterium]|nr:hypothetical protein [Aquificota bacterium]
MNKFLIFIFFISMAFSQEIYIENIGKIKSCSLPNDQVIKVYNSTITIKDLKPYLDLAKTLNEKKVNSIIFGAILDKLLEKKFQNNKKIDIAYYLFEKNSPKIALDYLSKKAKIKRKNNICSILYNSTLSALENAKITLENINRLLSNPIKFCKQANLSLDECEKQIEFLKNFKNHLLTSIKPMLFRYEALISKIYVSKQEFLNTLSSLLGNLDLEDLKSIVATYRVQGASLLILKYENKKFVDLITNKTVSEKILSKAYVIKGYNYPVRFSKIKSYLKKKKKPFVVLLHIPRFSKLTLDVCNLIMIRKINNYAANLLKNNINFICIDTSKIKLLKSYLK